MEKIGINEITYWRGPQFPRYELLFEEIYGYSSYLGGYRIADLN